MENINETVLDLIDHIDGGDALEAEKAFNNILQSRVDELLNAYKQDVATNMFNTEQCADCDEEQVDEAELEEAKTSPKKAKPSRAGNYDTPSSPDYLGDKKRTRSAPNTWVKRPPGGWPSAEKATNEEAEQIEETEVTNEALKGNQHKIDANKNGKIDAHDFKMLRKKKGMKEEVEVTEASYSAKMARAGKDIGKPGKMFGKIAKKAARKYGKERGAKIAGAVLAKLRKKGK